MKLHELQYTEGSRKTEKRRGRGLGSGLGKNGGSGNKGQKSRSGGGTRLGFEGGQNPIFRRLPKRGFNSHMNNHFDIVNVSLLNKFEDGSVIDMTTLCSLGYVSGKYPVKILGNGELERKLTIKAQAFTKSATAKIEAKGGTCETVTLKASFVEE